MATKATIKAAEQVLKSAQASAYNARNHYRVSQARYDANAATVAAGGTVKGWNEISDEDLAEDKAWHERAQDAMFDAEAALCAEKMDYADNPRARLG